jgi:AcrR family transcriptional regulator
MTASRREHRLRPRREPRQDRAAETRARLLDAAAGVFESRGYDGGTTNHIAEAASMSVGSLYQYFPNKDAILVELMVDHIATGGVRARQAIDAWSAAPAGRNAGLDEGLAGLIGVVVRELLALHREQPRLHQILMTRVPLPPDVAARIEVIEAELVTELVVLLGEITDLSGDDAVVRAAMAASTINALIHQQVARPEPPVPDVRFAAETTRLVAGYLSP